MSNITWFVAVALAVSECLVFISGCRKQGEQPPASAPSTALAEPAAPVIGPETSAVPIDMSLGWCGGHGVPESVCTRCNASLIPQFKQAGDWCTGHGLPESQCESCNPGVTERWAALQSKSSTVEPADEGDLRVERVPRLLTGSSDRLCQVENLQVRFIDSSIIRKAGIEIERAQRRPISAAITVPAQVEFDAIRLTRVASRLAGTVREMPVRLGDEVQSGTLLAVVDSAVLGEAKSEYVARGQDHRLAESDLGRVRTIAGGVRRMLEVCTPDAAADDIREALALSPVGDAKAKLLRAHAALQFARADAARKATLLEKNLSSERDHRAAQSTLAAAEAEFAALREEIAFSMERERIAAERAEEVARSALEASRRRLLVLGLTDKQVADIGSEPDELLTRYELHSPVGGRVIERAVTTGETVEANDVLFVVVDTSSMWLVADVNERELLRLVTGQPVFFTVDGLPGVSFEGQVSWISSQVDDRTRTVRLRADLPNSDGLLRAKMFGQARIVLRDNDEVITVPAGAVQTDGCCQLVFVQQSDTVFQPRKIVLGSSAGGYVEVLDGLAEGEAIAGTGSFLMKTEILKSNIGAGCCEVDPGR